MSRSRSGDRIRRRAAALLVTWLAAVAVIARQPALADVDAVLARLDDLYRSTSSVARIELQVTTARSTRSLRLKAWTRGEDEALIVIEAPPREEGTSTRVALEARIRHVREAGIV